MLGQKAAKYSQPPSKFIPGLLDELAGYQFDNAVLWFCNTVENALQEQEEIGALEKPRSRPRYTIQQLLDNDFRMAHDGDEDSDLNTLRGMEGYDEVG